MRFVVVSVVLADGRPRTTSPSLTSGWISIVTKPSSAIWGVIISFVPTSKNSIDSVVTAFIVVVTLNPSLDPMIISDFLLFRAKIFGAARVLRFDFS